MKNNPSVTVIIPTYKRADELQRALRSVKNQTFKDIEILVVDDNTDPIIESKVFELCVEYGASFLKNEREKGGCGARNTGIIRSQGEYVAFLDDDDFWLNNKLKDQVSFMVENGALASYSRFYLLYHSHLIFKEIKDNALRFLTFEDVLKGACPASTSLVIIKRSLFRDSGLFDESLPSFQDFDLWLRVSKIANFYLIDSPLSIFTFHNGDRASVNLEKRFKGLNIVVNKWRREINEVYTVGDFIRRYKSDAYNVNALSNEGVSYKNTLYFRFRALITNPTRIRLYRNAVMSLFGGNFYWYLVGLKKSKDVSLAKLIKKEFQ